MDDEYQKAAKGACERRLLLLADQLRRGVHTQEMHDILKSAIIRETEAAWEVVIGNA
jgi:hypothetical protein